MCLKRRLLKIEVAESLKLHSWDILPYIAVQHSELPSARLVAYCWLKLVENKVLKSIWANVP
jgi:hypothetical protein